MKNNYIGEKDIVAFSTAVNRLRQFFISKGFIEVHTQDRLSILAACEDPNTVAVYDYAGEKWPLPQTGQMWLEYELLNYSKESELTLSEIERVNHSEIPGVFCVSTSYRNEPNPVAGRHKIIFPMFEFESRGTIGDLRELEGELLEYLGFGEKEKFSHIQYDETKEKYGVSELGHEHEAMLCEEFGGVAFLERFPRTTSPFWNMKKDGPEHARKIDVLIEGMETIGSAERSESPEEMREEFYTISEGKYAEKLFSLFGRERVERELEEFLSMSFFPRFGGGIGVTRLISAMKLRKLI